jgi:GntR family transcriptional repressor for pyruvate dehydrogenase complex
MKLVRFQHSRATVTPLFGRGEVRPDGSQPDPIIRDADIPAGGHHGEGRFCRFCVHDAVEPLARMRTHEQVVAEIENRLMTGVLNAGDRLPPERQFAEALGVSRGAVREALRILEAIGVIEAGTGSGPSSGSMIVKDSIAGMAMVLRLHLQVASFSQDDLVEVRLLIERLAARKMAGPATAEDIAGLLSLVDQMREANTTTAYHELEAAFHARIVQAADNALAAVLVGALREAQLPASGARFDDPDFSESATQGLTGDCSAIVNAIADGDGDGDRAADLLAKTLGGARRPTGSSALKWAG